MAYSGVHFSKLSAFWCVPCIWGLGMVLDWCRLSSISWWNRSPHANCHSLNNGWVTSYKSHVMKGCSARMKHPNTILLIRQNLCYSYCSICFIAIALNNSICTQREWSQFMSYGIMLLNQQITKLTQCFFLFFCWYNVITMLVKMRWIHWYTMSKLIV